MMAAQAPARRRRVVVVGRSGHLDPERLAGEAAVNDDQLVLITVGYPVPPEHTRIVIEALRLADERRIFLDASLVLVPEEIRTLVQDGDEVTVLAAGRERAQIELVLGARERAGERLGSARLPQMAVVAAPVVASVAPAPALATGPSGTDRPSSGDAEPLGAAAGGSGGSESIEALAGREVLSPARETVWTRDDAVARKQASLRIYLGAAPGVGKTYAMLGEGQRRRARGTDVVASAVETYGRPKTASMLEGIEVLPPRRAPYRGTTFDELDVDGLIARKPEVALIDELAHTNVPGSRRAKRWEDVLDVLSRGIAVVTTLNVQHLASVNDVVAKVTGIRQMETVPDWVLDLADDVELVDMSPRALQRRMIHGNVYPDPRKSELALRRFFTIENLTALRELALMRLANQVDDELLARWRGAVAPETRERILVCVSRPDVAEDLIRRGGRIAQRTQGDLLVVTVNTDERHPDTPWLTATDRLVRDLGGEFEVLQGDDPVERVLSYAYQQHVTQIVVGESRRSRWQELFRGSFVGRLIRRASNIDIHVIGHRDDGSGRE